MRVIVERAQDRGPISGRSRVHFDKLERMRRSWALAWCTLAACSKHGGAEIVVKSPAGTTIDQIALYIGVGHAQTDGIGPQGYQAAISDKMMWWARDANGHDVANRVGSQVTFEYQASGSATDQLGVVIAVAFDQGVPVAAAYQQAVVVPVSSVARYTLDLQPVVDPRRNTSGFGLEVWGPAGDDTACVWVADRPNSNELMVVDDSDPDCDGVTGQAECDPRVYLAHRGPSIQNDDNHVKCLADEMITKAGGTTVTSCVLGGDLCIDGAGWSTNQCVNSVYCVPRSDCLVCANSTGSGAFPCVADISAAIPPTPNPTYTRIDCPLPVDVSGNVCQSTVTFDATTLAAQYGRTCKSDPLLFDVASGRWDNQTQVRGIQISVSNPQQTCSFDLGLSGSISNITGTALPSVLIAADLDNGRGVAIPITFHHSIECTNTPPCIYTGPAGAIGTSGDNIFPDCVNAAPLYPP
jgi:hypothetical protein